MIWNPTNSEYGVRKVGCKCYPGRRGDVPGTEFQMIWERTGHLLNGYIQRPSILQHKDTYIVPPKLGKDAGLLGRLPWPCGGMLSDDA